MLRVMWRELETGSRTSLAGHEGGNPGYRQGMFYRVTAPALDPTTYRDNKVEQGVLLSHLTAVQDVLNKARESIAENLRQLGGTHRWLITPANGNSEQPRGDALTQFTPLNRGQFTSAGENKTITQF